VHPPPIENVPPINTSRRSAHPDRQLSPQRLRSLWLAFAWPVFWFVRAVESVSPLWLLRLLLWPLAVARVIAELPRWPQLRREFRALPDELRPTVSFPLRRLCFYLARFLAYFPDRLAAPRWRDRCRFEGWCDWMNDGETPVVFASLHFGPYLMLPYWLRACGVPVSTLVREPVQARSSLKRRRYELTPLPQLPVVFSFEELRKAHSHLAAGNSLVVMMDGTRGRRARVPFVSRFFIAATGAQRLAVSASARLVPCLIAETAPWQFTIFFGAPVPEELMNDGRAAAHCVGEFLKVIACHPEQCGREVLRCLQPLATP
jgi:hypothetical protein